MFYFDTDENNVFFQCKMTKDGYKIYDLRPSVITSIFKARYRPRKTEKCLFGGYQPKTDSTVLRK